MSMLNIALDTQTDATKMSDLKHSQFIDTISSVLGQMVILLLVSVLSRDSILCHVITIGAHISIPLRGTILEFLLCERFY